MFVVEVSLNMNLSPKQTPLESTTGQIMQLFIFLKKLDINTLLLSTTLLICNQKCHLDHKGLLDNGN